MQFNATRVHLLISMALGAAFVFGGPAVDAQSLTPELAKQVIQSVDNDSERLTGIFKDFHQHSELGLMETHTAGIVAKELKALAVDYFG